MLLIASDKTTNGKRTVLVCIPSTIMTDHSIGRGLGVVSRSHASAGYMDLDLDDYKQDSLFQEWQKIVLDTAGILVVSEVITLRLKPSEF
jgi:hypothetical protein